MFQDEMDIWDKPWYTFRRRYLTDINETGPELVKVSADVNVIKGARLILLSKTGSRIWRTAVGGTSRMACGTYVSREIRVVC